MTRHVTPCRRCSTPVTLPDGAPVPEGGAFCPACARRADEQIKLSLFRLTGSFHGGITIIDGRLIARQRPD